MKSTRVQVDPLINGLLLNGHKITSVFSFPSTISNKNYTEIVIPDNGANWYENFSEKVFLDEAGPNLGSFKTFRTMMMNGKSNLDIAYDLFHIYDELSDLISDKNTKIDAIIVTAFTGNAYFYLAELLDCPVIVFSPEGPMAGLLGNLGNPDNPTWQVSNYSPLVEPMTFLERIFNVWNRLLFRSFQSFYINLIRKELEKKFSVEIPDLMDMERKVRRQHKSLNLKSVFI